MDKFSHIKFAALSDVGRKRQNNEDSYGTFPQIGVFCVADGMGGGDDGEVASAATVHAVENFAKANPFKPNIAYTKDSLISGIRLAVNSASAWILNRAQEKMLKGCGSTFVGVCFDAGAPDNATALHAGDSRLYRIRGRAIQQITKDHSAAELIGAKDESEINPMFRGMILRAVGVQKSVELDATPFQVRQGDRILICSDGLSKMLADKTISAIVRESESVETAAKALVAAANNAGGLDNVTVVLLEVGKLPEALPTMELKLQPVAVNGDVTDRDEEHTVDTGSETGVSFDLGANSSSNTSCGSGRHEFTAVTAMTIPEDECEALAAETGAPAEEPRCGKRRKLKAALFAGISLLAVTVGVVVSVMSKVEDERQKEDERVKTEVLQRQQEELRRIKKDEALRQEKKRAEETEKNRLRELERRRIEQERVRLDAEKRDLEAKLRSLEEERRKEEAALKELKAEQERQRIQHERELREKELKRAEEEKRRKDAAAAAERKAREEKDRIEREKAAMEKLAAEKSAAKAVRRAEAAIVSLKRVSDVKTASAFARKVHSLVNENIFDAACCVFRPMRSAKTKEESAAAAVNLVKAIQPIAEKLLEYAETYRSDAINDLRDPSTSEDYRRELKEIPEKMSEFIDNAKRIVGRDAADPDVHLACARMIELVPLWF